MSESDDMLSSVDSTESVASREESQGETSDEMEVVGQVQPYTDEPLVHISGEDETTREDEDQDHRSFASSSTKQIQRRSSRK